MDASCRDRRPEHDGAGRIVVGLPHGRRSLRGRQPHPAALAREPNVADGACGFSPRALPRCTRRAISRRSPTSRSGARLQGTAYPRGAVLIPAEVGGVIVVASSGYDESDEAPAFSRSLLVEAAMGDTVALADAVSPAAAASMAEGRVERALCAPVLLGDAVCAFVYLDVPTNHPAAPADAGPFCESIARALASRLPT